jgi:hypothetical protein
MLFNKYDMLVFRADSSKHRQMRFRSIWIVSALLVFAGLVSAEIFFFRYYLENKKLEKSIQSYEALSQKQQLAILSLVNRARYLETDLVSAGELNGKLQVILELTQNDSDQSAVGGSYGGELTARYPAEQRMESLARSLHNFLKHLETTSQLEEVRQQEIIGAIRNKQERWAVTPSIWPTHGRITSPFGWRSSPFTGGREFHQGLDISATVNTPVTAPARGKVIFACRNGSYGLVIGLDHGFNITTRYAHLHRIAVKKGDIVNRGDIIGYVGNTGRSTGPHLHYEVRRHNKPVNPLAFIAD